MNPVIEEIYRTKKTEDTEGREIDAFPISIRYDEGMALYDLVRKTGAKRTLEIGMAYGLSTLFICQAHHDNGEGYHVTIDPYEKDHWRSVGLLNVKKAGFEKYTKHYNSPSHEVLPGLLSDKERFDFVFVDGSHLFDHALIDFFYMDKLLKAGGYVMFDDLWMPSIRKVISFILRNRNYALRREFIREAAPLMERMALCLRDASQASFDPYSLFLKWRLIYGMSNYCVLQKISDDERNWEFYRAF